MAYLHNDSILRGSGIIRSAKGESKVIEIGKLSIENDCNRVRVSSFVSVDGGVFPLWFSVPVKYKKYISDNCADAFVVTLLNLAMREGWDIHSQTPITKSLYFKLTKNLLPTLCANSPRFHCPKILAETIPDVRESFGAVGTGISCGVDSLHVLALYGHECKDDDMRVTHLVCNNVWPSGSAGGKRHQDQLAFVRKFADVFGYELIDVDTNLYEDFFQNHLFAHTYVNLGAILVLNGFWGKYYYASSGLGPKNSLNISNIEYRDCSYYDLFLCSNLSPVGAHFFSLGADVDRFSKMKILAEFPPAWKWLNVCGDVLGKNCGRCGKCCRVLTMLDALGDEKLYRFRESFDIEYYLKKRHWYMRWAIINGVLGREVLGDSWKAFVSRVSMKDWMIILLSFPYWCMRPIIRRNLAKVLFLRKIYKKYF